MVIRSPFFRSRIMGGFGLCVKQPLGVPPEAGLCTQLAGIRIGTGCQSASGGEVETAPGARQGLKGGSPQADEEIWVERSHRP
jgi:hypothetical protein